MAEERNYNEPVADDLQPDADSVTVQIDGRIVWQAIGAIVLTGFVIWMVTLASSLVAMLAIAFFFSLALDPGVRWFVNHRGWRRGAATGAIYVGGIIVVVLLVVIMIPAMADLARAIGEQGSEWIADLQTWASDTFNIDTSAPDPVGQTTEAAGDAAADYMDYPFGTVLGIAVSGVGILFDLLTIATFTFYFTADMPRIQRAVLRLFSPPMQQRVGWTWDQAIVQTGGYFYSRLLLMLINGLGFFFTMVLVGMPVSTSLALAIFAGFLSEFIPVIGTYIGGAIPCLLTLAFQGLTAALIVLAYVLIYQQIENLLLSPKLSSKTMTLSGGVAFGAAMAGGAIAGPMGAFTALPVAALITSFMRNYGISYDLVYEAEPPEPKPDHVKLRERMQRARSAAKRHPATDDRSNQA
jgi:predicted PurR-regulated permease PerM